MSNKSIVSRPTTHMEVEGDLCKLFYAKFGDEALLIIRQVFRDWGLVVGERRKAKMRQMDFETAVKAFLEPTMNREPKPEILSSTKDRIEVKVYTCPYRLGGAGRELCDAMTEMDRAVLESLIGSKVKVENRKTIAAGDDCCWMILEP